MKKKITYLVFFLGGVSKTKFSYQQNHFYTVLLQSITYLC